MKIKHHSHDHFCFGFCLDFTHGSFLSLGWITFVMVPPLESILGDLPLMQLGGCTKCGSNDWTACNQTYGLVTDCNKCGGYEGGPK